LLVGIFRIRAFIATDRRRKNVKRDGFASSVDLANFAIIRSTGATLVTIPAARTILAAEAIAAVRAFSALLSVVLPLASLDQLFLALILVDLVLTLAALLVLILEAGTALA
jgi:hypothetical protein